MSRKIEIRILGMENRGRRKVEDVGVYSYVVSQILNRLRRMGVIVADYYVEVTDIHSKILLSEQMCRTSPCPQLQLHREAFGGLKQWIKNQGLSMAEVSRKMKMRPERLAELIRVGMTGRRMIGGRGDGLASRLRELNNPAVPAQIILAFEKVSEFSRVLYYR